MKIVSLDVHSEVSQLTLVAAETGEILLEVKVPTEAEALRSIVGGITGPKRVVLEQGPMSGMIHDALADLADEVVSCDPTHNALIARAEDSNDERDARRLAQLARLDAVRSVYVPPEPYRTLRSLLKYDCTLQGSITEVKNRIRAMYRRLGVRVRRQTPWYPGGRSKWLAQITQPGYHWQVESLYRRMDVLRLERVGVHRVLTKFCKDFPEVERLQTIPGVGPITARTLVAWIVNPKRFHSRSALSSYGGLGLCQDWTNWKQVGRARASKRGNRAIKRVLFLAAKAASRTNTRLARRYAARRVAGWDTRKAMRDMARTILEIACTIWRKETDYDDAITLVPEAQT